MIIKISSTHFQETYKLNMLVLQLLFAINKLCYALGVVISSLYSMIFLVINLITFVIL